MCQLSQEKEKHERLNGGEEYEELEEAQEQVKRLRNELKIRHKMNQLQTNKACLIKTTKNGFKFYFISADARGFRLDFSPRRRLFCLAIIVRGCE